MSSWIPLKEDWVYEYRLYMCEDCEWKILVPFGDSISNYTCNCKKENQGDKHNG